VETTERIVESYVRYIKHWLTLPNIPCAGQFEIDLLAMNPVTCERYHIESGVSVSGAYSKLSAKKFDPARLKERNHQAEQRRTLGYFVDRKFGDPNVVKRLRDFGFKKGNHSRIIVSWGWQAGVEAQAKAAGVILWDFRDLIKEIGEAFVEDRTYFGDDTLRTLHLFVLALSATKKI
jgi:hypothetical protein